MVRSFSSYIPEIDSTRHDKNAKMKTFLENKCQHGNDVEVEINTSFESITSYHSNPDTLER